MNLALVPPLLAAGDVGQIIIGLFAVIFVIIRGIIEANKHAGAMRNRQPIPPPQPQGPAPGGAPAAGQQADPLRAQVEEFLRRSGKLAQPKESQPPAPTPDSRSVGEPLRQAEWRKPTAPSTPQSAPAADKSRSNRGAGKQRRRQSVAEHVAEQVAAHAQNISDKASQLGQRIAAEDQQFDVQLKAKFDHAVGTLPETAMPAATEPTPLPVDTPASQLAALLANPGGIRQAVLLNEVLRRPSERW